MYGSDGVGHPWPWGFLHVGKTSTIGVCLLLPGHGTRPPAHSTARFKCFMRNQPLYDENELQILPGHSTERQAQFDLPLRPFCAMLSRIVCALSLVAAAVAVARPPPRTQFEADVHTIIDPLIDLNIKLCEWHPRPHAAQPTSCRSPYCSRYDRRQSFRPVARQQR